MKTTFLKDKRIKYTENAYIGPAMLMNNNKIHNIRIIEKNKKKIIFKFNFSRDQFNNITYEYEIPRDSKYKMYILQ